MINPMDPVRFPISEMIGDENLPMMMHGQGPMKIIQDEETGKQETSCPERIRHPGIERIIGERRCVVGHNRRPYSIVVVIYNTRILIVGFGRRGRTVVNSIPRIWCQRQSESGQNIIKQPHRHVPVHRKFAIICGIYYGVSQLTGYIGSYRVIGNPAAPRRDPEFCQTTLSLGFVSGNSHTQGCYQLNGKLTFANQLLFNRRRTGTSLLYFRRSYRQHDK
jgi:hypothetical protein